MSTFNWTHAAARLALHPILAMKAAFHFARGDSAAGTAALGEIQAAEVQDEEAVRTAAFAARLQERLKANAGVYFPSDEHGRMAFRFPQTEHGPNRFGQDSHGFTDPNADGPVCSPETSAKLAAQGRDPWGFNLPDWEE